MIKRTAMSTVALAAIACSALAQAEEPVSALWKSQEINFTYQGFTTRFTCDGLRDRVRAILLELGARPDLKATALGCSPSNLPSPFPSVRLVIATPVEATPENVIALSQDAGRKDRDSSRAPAEGIGSADRFAASWRTVNLAQSGSRLRIERGECELIEQLRDHVFPQLQIRVIEDHTRCVPNQVSFGQPNMRVAALVSAPRLDGAKPN
jgi:hypothetical protein